MANFGFLGYDFGLDQGFQYYDPRWAVRFTGGSRKFYLRNVVCNVLAYFVPNSDYYLSYRRAEEINKEVFTLLDKVQEKSEKFFLFVNYMDAHDPYIPPFPFDTFYPGKDKKFRWERYDILKKRVMRMEGQVMEGELRHLLSQYDGGIAYIDFHVGKLIARMKELKLYENCLIIITSDRGEAFGERNLFHHGVSLYQD